MNNPILTTTEPPTCRDFLRARILKLINEKDSTSILSDDTRLKMSAGLAVFIDLAIDKFLKGQLEHGGQLESRDLDRDMGFEIIDLMWYQLAKGWK